VFSGANRNKQGITLDLRHPRGVELFLQLVATGDVVVENYTPRVMDGFGLPFERLRAVRPDLIMVSLPAYGGTGPWRDYPGFAFPVEEMAGFPQLTGYADDGVPRRWGNAAADSIAGLNGAYAVLTALEQRRRTGEGQHIDLSQVEALTCFLGEPILDYQVNHRLPRRMGSRDAAYAPQGVYPCAGNDRWIAISATDEAQWQSLCACIGRTEWPADPHFATPAARQRHHDDLDVGITDWTCERDRLDAMRALQGAGVPAMPVMASYELLEDEHLRARDYFQEMPREVVGTQTHGIGAQQSLGDLNGRTAAARGGARDRQRAGRRTEDLGNLYRIAALNQPGNRGITTATATRRRRHTWTRSASTNSTQPARWHWTKPGRKRSRRCTRSASAPPVSVSPI
jgi:crotonobetainyl-CoA:carnitine CoA-transferase CaiB-like acyl-CoA transferase